jgi:DNA-binding NarL/FixJ family response regulator
LTFVSKFLTELFPGGSAVLGVIIVENQTVIRRNLEDLSSGDWGIKIVGYAQDWPGVFRLCDQREPDLVLVELFTPGSNDLENIKILKTKQPAVKVLALAAVCNEVKLVQALKEGVDGCLDIDTKREGLIAAIKSVANGLKVIDKELYRFILKLSNDDQAFGADCLYREALKNELTDRQLLILGLLAKGLKEKAVADEIGLSINTVKYHKKKIFEKLEVECTNEALVKAFRMKLLISRTDENSRRQQSITR